MRSLIVFFEIVFFETEIFTFTLLQHILQLPYTQCEYPHLAPPYSCCSSSHGAINYLVHRRDCFYKALMSPLIAKVGLSSLVSVIDCLYSLLLILSRNIQL
ncbi:hypothetical protein LI328DRAFT_129509 [Trichoderma asperelloides]|nr:hypothetical protein LI328DRAFT_129509 [Trichoderma asperelloides]